MKAKAKATQRERALRCLDRMTASPFSTASYCNAYRCLDALFDEITRTPDGSLSAFQNADVLECLGRNRTANHAIGNAMAGNDVARASLLRKT